MSGQQCDYKLDYKRRSQFHIYNILIQLQKQNEIARLALLIKETIDIRYTIAFQTTQRLNWAIKNNPILKVAE
ncbi:hypothetical protein FGO68_gene5998 [Halteria grandinella]|uniref:Uncharacterized protein n=1 Tax=Halteria grandinella TaxID=5974 RepID=A0A8J8NJI9_HALGN|nr:hypothetical protein FGO68_gene5998 [Halteria grandinella]